MSQEQSSGVPGWLNTVMKGVLRSPLHSMVSKSILLISFTGRKSGKTYTTPVSYMQEGDVINVFTHGQWWRNLQGGAPVTLRLRGKNVQGMGEPVVEDKAAIAETLTRHLRRNHIDAKYYGVTYDEQGEPRPDEVQRGAEDTIMIRIHLN